MLNEKLRAVDDPLIEQVADRQLGHIERLDDAVLHHSRKLRHNPGFRLRSKALAQQSCRSTVRVDALPKSAALKSVLLAADPSDFGGDDHDKRLHRFDELLAEPADAPQSR